MTPNEQHRLTHDRIVASLLLADTRSERHGVYASRKPAPRVARPRAFVIPVVTERKL